MWFPLVQSCINFRILFCCFSVLACSFVIRGRFIYGISIHTFNFHQTGSAAHTNTSKHLSNLRVFLSFSLALYLSMSTFVAAALTYSSTVILYLKIFGLISFVYLFLVFCCVFGFIAQFLLCPIRLSNWNVNTTKL